MAKEKSPGSHCTTCLSQTRSGFRDGPTHDVALPEDGRPTHRAAALGLFSILDTAATRRLVLFKAPAGYDKTSLAATWCQRLQFTGAIVAWLSLDTDDDEPGAFAYHLTMAVERASTDLGNGAIELLQGSGLIPPRNVVSALVNAATESDHELFVLLDDFHVLTDQRCHDLIDFCSGTLVILTRSEPRLPLSRLRLEDEITEIDASLLHFDLSETQQLLGSDLCKLLSAGCSRASCVDRRLASGAAIGSHIVAELS